MPEVSTALVPLKAEVEKLSCSLSRDELGYLKRAARLFQDEYFEHSLLDLWNAAVCNLRRRVEAYGVDLFLSTVKDEKGRAKYNPNGDGLGERWEGVE